MTEEEFVAWSDEDTRAEWVDGEIELMSPANVTHLRLTRWLVMVLGGFIEAHDLGELFAIESMVRFASQRRRRLPDLHFVSKNRLQIVRETYIDGAPDLIVEIVSPDSVVRDWRKKYIEYEKAGVREYWVIDPIHRQVEAYSLRGRRYVQTEPADDRIDSVVLPRFFLKPQWLWRQPLPPTRTALRQLGVKP